MTNKTNTACRQILETKDVLESQVLSTVLSNTAVNPLSLDEKKALSLLIKSDFAKQFNSLVDRVQKALS